MKQDDLTSYPHHIFRGDVPSQVFRKNIDFIEIIYNQTNLYSTYITCSVQRSFLFKDPETYQILSFYN